MKLWLDSLLLIFLSLLFISTSLDKIKNKRKSILAIVNYGVSEIIAKLLYLPLLSFELYLGLSFLFYGLNFYNFVSLCIFLAFLSMIILRNLIKGNKALPCGCGGILDNDELSYKIIVRNLFILLLASYLAVIDVNLIISLFEITVLTVSTISIFFIISAFKELNSINRMKKKLLNYF